MRISCRNRCPPRPLGRKTGIEIENPWVPWEMIYTWSGWWLGHPSEKYESQLGWLFPIYGKIKNVPNHQPVIYVPTPCWFAGFSLSLTHEYGHISRIWCHRVPMDPQWFWVVPHNKFELYPYSHMRVFICNWVTPIIGGLQPRCHADLRSTSIHSNYCSWSRAPLLTLHELIRLLWCPNGWKKDTTLLLYH